MRNTENVSCGCINCGSRNVSVTECRQYKSTIYARRRRFCLNCKHKWSTVEIEANEYKTIKEGLKNINKLVEIYNLIISKN